MPQDRVSTPWGDILAETVNKRNGTAVTPDIAAQLLALGVITTDGEFTDLSLGAVLKAKALAVTFATDDTLLTQLLARFPASLDPATGALKTVGAIASTTWPFMQAATLVSVNVKPTPATLVYLAFYKATAGAYYVKLYDKVAAPTASDTPRITHKVTDTFPLILRFDPGEGYVNGLGIRITANAAASDANAPAAGDAFGGAGYI